MVDIEESCDVNFPKTWEHFCEQANSLVSVIHEELIKIDPIVLLGFANKIASHSFVILNGQVPEYVSKEEPGALRLCEYIQTVLVSTESSKLECLDITEGVEISLLNNAVALYRLMVWVSLYSDKIYQGLPRPIEDDLKKALTPNLQMFAARGKRDASFQRHYHSVLIGAQHSILERVYGISAVNLIEGFERLQEQLRLAWSNYHEQTGTLTLEKYYDFSLLASRDEIADMFDVAKITGWPEKLIDDLSYGLGDNKSFYTGRFPGWPIKDLCIKDRPFIKIRGRSFAFCYYIVCDYFYRALEQAVSRRCKSAGIVYEWDKPQCQASERETERIFRSLLPNAQFFSNNTYSISGSRNKSDENDILVIIHDVVIVIEIKGGRRWHDSPAEKGHALRMNYNDIRKGVAQCNRMEDYLKKSPAPVLYNKDWTRKVEQPRVPNNAYWFKIVVTVDSANEIAASTENLSGFIGDCSGVVCVSLDDLLVYEWWFKGRPIFFLSFLRARSAATNVASLFVCDELVHLASFINCPYYPEFALDVSRKGFDFIDMGDVREITNVLDARNTLGDDIPRKFPSIPEFFNFVFELMDRTQNKYALKIATLLLSLDSSSRIKMALDIQRLVRRFLEKSLPLTAGLNIRRNELLVVVVSDSFPNAVPVINISTKHSQEAISQGKIKKAHLLVIYVNPISQECIDIEIKMDFLS